MPPASGPSWRGSSQKPATGGVRSWRRPGAGSATTWNPKSRWVNSLVSGFYLLVSFAAIFLLIYLVFLPGCNQTNYAVITPAPYKNLAIPPQPYVERDSRAFSESFGIENSFPLLEAKETSDLAKTPKRKLSPARTAQVIYLTALAGQTDQGVGLYCRDPGPDDIDKGANESNYWIPLNRLEDLLKSLPSGQKKILLIDLACGPVDWRWGQFFRPKLGKSSDLGDVAGSLDDLLSKIDNLAVITSVAPGETSWAIPRLKTSVFTHFLLRAFAGEADGSGGGPKDQRVTLREFFHFLETRTNYWVEQTRDPRGQHPQLYLSKGSRSGLLDEVIAVFDKKVRDNVKLVTQESTLAIDGTQVSRIEKIWLSLDQWKSNDLAQWHPLAWRQLLEHVHRAEQWWLEGQSENMRDHLDAAEEVIRRINERANVRDRFELKDSRQTRRVVSGAFLERDSDLLPERQLQQALNIYALPTVPKDDLQQTVALKTSAESLSWHSYRSRFWTDSVLAEADQDRRSSEDLLFVGGQVELQEAGRLRKNAEKKLQQYKEIVDEMVELVRLQNDLLAELPELARWAALRIPNESKTKSISESARYRMMAIYSKMIAENKSQPPHFLQQERELNEFASDPNELQATEAQILLIFQQARQLGRLIDREKESPTQLFAATTGWRSEREAVSAAIKHPDHGLQALIRRLIRRAKDLTGSSINESSETAAADEGQTQKDHWNHLRNALQWSGLPGEMRRNLFDALDRSDRTLFKNAQDIPPAGYTAKWNADDRTGVDGCWQALWTLQILSLDPSYPDMDQRWVDWKNIWLDTKNQSQELARLGASARKEFRDRAKRTYWSPTESDQLDESLRTLLNAERAVRSLHGYDAVGLKQDDDPVRKIQDFDLGALCIQQADRYLEDFWNSTTPRGDPWYVYVVTQCLRAIDRPELSGVRSFKSAREKILARLDVRKSGRLKITSVDSSVDLTLDQQRQAKVSISIDDQIPSGTAAIWLEERDADDATRVLNFSPSGRKAIAARSATAEFTIRKQTQPSEAACAAIGVKSTLYFRARDWDKDDKRGEISVNPCRPNAIRREYQAPPASGTIVVRGADRRDTIFVLDCSLSMGEKMKSTEKSGQPERRFDVARRKLSEILKVLRDAPANRNEKEPHVVGLMAYGHRAKGKNGTDVPAALNTDWPRQLPPELLKNWKVDYEMLMNPAPLVGDRFNQMNAYLDPDNPIAGIPLLQPFGETPLLGAAKNASDFLVDQKRGGVVVIICDGDYNDEDPRKNSDRYSRLVDLYRGHPELSLHLVAFDLDQEAEITSLNKLAEKTRGKFHLAPTAGALAQAIDQAMRPRPFSVVRDVEPIFKQDSALSQPVERLLPDSYLVRFPGLRDFPVSITGGEQLEFRLQSDNLHLKHYRPIVKLSKRAQLPHEPGENEPTRFGYLKAEFDKISKRALFQFSLDRDDSTGMVDRPKEISIDVTPIGSTRRYSQLWKLAQDQSVPVWQIEVSDWPAEAKPEVQASWKMQRTAPDEKISLPSLLKEPQTISLDEWPERGLGVKAELQGTQLIVSLESRNNVVAQSTVADIRLEVGEVSLVESQFQPKAFNWKSEFFEQRGLIIYKFDVGERLDTTKLVVGFTAPNSLKQNVSQLRDKLVIEKWDGEL